MSQLVDSSPLLQPIIYDGQAYFTSQYFHAQYLANSPHGGKYRQHKHFLHALRSIETYTEYVEQSAIIEIAWSEAKILDSNQGQYVVTEGKQGSLSWKAIFQATGYQPLTLLNATAQAAMSHHLDDAISKQMSVAINTTIARQLSPSTTLAESLPEELATRRLRARMDAAAVLGTPLYLAQQEAVKAVLATTGIDFRPLLKGAPAQDQIAHTDRMLEPTELAKELGIRSARVMNLSLEALGWQVQKIGGGWEPTPAGKPYCAEHAWSSDYSTKTGLNFKWNVSAVRHALAQAQQSQAQP